MNGKLKAFTLVEMLIVMGIIIILMAVGIASGRFAIRRANKIEHQNAAEQIYQAMQSYYTDNREYPVLADGSTPDFSVLMGATYLDGYIDDFDGGSEASYAYAVDATGQEALVCVTYGGNGDANDLGLYCTGNGIGGDITNAPSEKDMDYSIETDYNTARLLFTDPECADWNPADQTWGTCTTVNEAS